jgi:hypothetical protein
MFTSLVLASTTPVVGGFEKLSADTPFFTWNFFTIAIPVVAIVLAFLYFLHDEWASPLFLIFIVIVVFIFTQLFGGLAANSNAVDKNAVKQLPDYDKWVSERYGLNGLPKDVLKDLYSGTNVDLINIGTVTMMEQGENTFYLVYDENDKELPVVGDTSGQKEKTNTW